MLPYSRPGVDAVSEWVEQHNTRFTGHYKLQDGSTPQNATHVEIPCHVGRTKHAGVVVFMRASL